ncbi:NADH-quinone oxidoreductase subunit N [Actinomyces bovis]|uniref:NADH-quinone oxidoreductase subunit N n=1 Tax=Actinomyces bovis TaxID=1658 RepID=A0ABY1VN59_9ACTO|nr:NADH-quinone oxidoreductase subunit NuoN [Actinomyces bovis]SPT53258.1 NADH-quinone oxidoreductase subunit N [Actinomyces bovis]VEG52531.1 NADH-quinone oxidoreductase subunit N [Actinomyces israelii]
MSTFTAPSIAWSALIPVLIVAGAALLGVLVEALAPRSIRPVTQLVLSVLAVLGAAVALGSRWVQVNSGSVGTITGGLSEDTFAVGAQAIILVIGFLSLLVMGDRTSANDGAFAAQAADRPGSAEETESLHAGWTTSEVYPLTLFSLAGMMLFPMANDFISLFVTLELVSLPLYVLAATARHRRLLSQEAALKYFVLGSFASAFLLMGAALLYGFSGRITYAGVATAINSSQSAGGDWLVLAGVVLVTVGLLFKVAAAPFHAWSPDVYQGAPTPITGFMAAGVKAAAFLALVRFYYLVAGSFGWDLAPFLWTVILLTMVVGTVVGIVQMDIKRMLAYSAIAHAGFMLIGLIGFNRLGVLSILFYSLVYGVATVGAFGIVSLVRVSHAGTPGAEATELAAWQGLGRRSPLLAAAMGVFLLSFAGIPLTAGFVAKFQVFVAGAQGGAILLVVAAVLSSAATAFFYIRLMVLMFFREPQEESGVVVTSDGTAAAAILIAVCVTLVLGVLPGPLLEVLTRAAMLIP